MAKSGMLLIARSKIVLNVHSFDTPILEQVRISYLLNNARFVISEGPAGQFEEMIVVGDYDQLPELCERYLTDEPERRKIAETGFLLFRKRPMTTDLKKIIGSEQLTSSAEMTEDELFELAFNDHQAGRLDDAEAKYRQILTSDPDDADLHQLLGMIA